MSLPNKSAIREAFNRAAADYDSAATVQRTICQHLRQGLPPSNGPEALLDAGCGTGYGLGLLRQHAPLARLLALDFAPAMLQQTTTPALRLAGDIEQLPLADAMLDGWWSSLTVQWCDASLVTREAHRCLKPGAWLALSTLGPQTFHEVRQAFASIDGYRHTLAFSPADTLSQTLASAGFQGIRVTTEMLTVHYPDLKTLLGAVKAIGANRVGEGQRTGLMGKAAWRRVQDAYETYRTPAGLPLSYEVIYCHATK